MKAVVYTIFLSVIVFFSGMYAGYSIDQTDEELRPYLEAREKIEENFLNNQDIDDELLNHGSIEGMLNVIDDKYARFKKPPAKPENKTDDVPGQKKDDAKEIADQPPSATLLTAETDDGHTVAIISLHDFDFGPTLKQFNDIADKVVKMKAKGIVLDLRGNRGGMLSVASAIAGLWIGKRVVCLKEGPAGKDSVTSDVNAVLDKIPTVVLIDRSTASAAEVLTGALRDYYLAHVIGEQSFGKGIGQNTYTLPDGSEVTFTTFYWKTPNGHSIHGKGIRPDQEVESNPWSYITEDEDNIDAAVDEDPPLKRAFDYLTVTIS
jgi:C-terminal processing protease CtpA/Prc